MIIKNPSRLIKKLSAGVLSLAFLASTAATPALAENWTLTGSNIWNNNSGNVGIGNSTGYSDTKLSVRGSISGATAGYGLMVNPTINATVANYQFYATRSLATFNVGSYSTTGYVAAVYADGQYSIKTGSGTIANAYGLLATQPTIGTNNAAIRAVGNIDSAGSAGVYTTGTINSTGVWYSFAVTFPYPWSKIPSITLTHDNSGTGDVVVQYLRVQKNSATKTGFTLDAFFAAVGTVGTTKFNWTAM